MGNSNIILTRIDNRLVHGQVGMLWTKAIGVNLLLVVDDDVATDMPQRQLMKMTADSSGVDIRFFTIQKTIEVIHKASPKQKIFLICKTPAIVRQLIDGGVPLNDVNIGNMHAQDGKKQITRRVFVDDQDLQDLHYLETKGLNVYIQDVPDEQKIQLSDI